MSIPSAPSTADLKAGLNVIGRNVRTYRFKLNANWNIKPLKPLTQFSGKDFKNISELTRALNEQKGLMNELKNLKKTADDVKKTTKTANESKTLWDKFLGKSGSKFGSAVDKAADAGGVVAKGGAALAKFAPILTAMAAVGITLVANIIQGWRTDINEKGLIKLGDDVSKVLGILNQYQQRIEANKTAINEQRLDNQRTRDRIYGLEKQNVGIGNGIDKAKKDANDALYEARKGRDIVEKKINDNLYEFRETKKRIEKDISQTNADFKRIGTDFNKYIGGLNDGFQKKIEATVNTLQKSLNTANTEIKKANDTISFQAKTIREVQNLTNEGSSLIKSIPQKIAAAIVVPFQRQQKIIDNLNDAIKYNQTVRQEDRINLSGRIQAADTAIKDMSAEIRASKNKIVTIESGGILVSKTIYSDGTKALEKKIAEVAAQKNSPPDLSGIRADIGRVQSDLNTTKSNLTTIDTKIKEQEKVNQEGNRKLDQLFPLVSGLPLIVGRAEQNIINKLPTPDDLANAAATGVCRSTKPGGCMNKALNDNANDIKTNANNNAGATLDAINAGLNGALLAGQQTILARLGAQLPGGISAFLTNFLTRFNKVAEWLHLDRALNILIWWQTLHNAYMLSANLGQTLTSAISNVLAVIGIKDAEGSPLDIATILGSQFDNLAKTVIGESEWGGIKAEYKKWNRIYQAAANLMNSIQSIGYSILSALEVVGSWVASIGNALKKWGEVGETAYRWMNPTPNFQNKFFTALEKTEDVVSQIDSVASEVLSVQETVTQIGTQKAEFLKALGQEPNGKAGATPPEAAKVKAEVDASKTVSATGVAISDTDKEADE